MSFVCAILFLALNGVLQLRPCFIDYYDESVNNFVLFNISFDKYSCKYWAASIKSPNHLSGTFSLLFSFLL